MFYSAQKKSFIFYSFPFLITALMLLFSTGCAASYDNISEITTDNNIETNSLYEQVSSPEETIDIFVETLKQNDIQTMLSLFTDNADTPLEMSQFLLKNNIVEYPMDTKHILSLFSSELGEKADNISDVLFVKESSQIKDNMAVIEGKLHLYDNPPFDYNDDITFTLVFDDKDNQWKILLDSLFL